jgi:hypothetical protein
VICPLTPADEEMLEAFLLEHRDSSMFLRSSVLRKRPSRGPSSRRGNAASRVRFFSRVTRAPFEPMRRWDSCAWASIRSCCSGDRVHPAANDAAIVTTFVEGPNVVLSPQRRKS